MISLFIYKHHFSFNTEAIFANVKINVKQSEMKDLVAVHLYRKYLQNLKQCVFWLVFHPVSSCPLRTGGWVGGGLLNRQNPLSMIKFICQWQGGQSNVSSHGKLQKNGKKTLFGFTTENWKTMVCKMIYT